MDRVRPRRAGRQRYHPLSNAGKFYRRPLRGLHHAGHLSSVGKEVLTYGLCVRPQGLDPCKKQGAVWPDKTADCMPRGGALDGLAALFSFAGQRPHQRRRPGDDLRHAPRPAVRAVREVRPAVRGGDRADRPKPLPHAQSPALSDQQPLRRVRAAAQTGNGGESDCPKRKSQEKNRKSKS